MSFSSEAHIIKAFNDTVKRCQEEINYMISKFIKDNEIYVSYYVFHILYNSEILVNKASSKYSKYSTWADLKNTNIIVVRMEEIDDEHILLFNLRDLLTDEEQIIKDIIK